MSTDHNERCNRVDSRLRLAHQIIRKCGEDGPGPEWAKRHCQKGGRRLMAAITYTLMVRSGRNDLSTEEWKGVQKLMEAIMRERLQ